MPAAIAVVHDDPSVVVRIARMLDQTGYHPILIRRLVHGTMQVFDTISQSRPALVVLEFDPTQPDEEWKVLQLLWLNRATEHIPVLLCVPEAHMVRAEVTRLTAKGCVVLPKPFTADELLAKVVTVVGPPMSDGSMASRHALG